MFNFTIIESLIIDNNTFEKCEISCLLKYDQFTSFGLVQISNNLWKDSNISKTYDLYYGLNYSDYNNSFISNNFTNGLIETIKISKFSKVSISNLTLINNTNGGRKFL